MHIGILFAADTFLFARQAGQVMGRGVANDGLVRALLRHAGPHRLTLIVSSAAEVEIVREQLQLADDAVHAVISLPSLPELVRTAPFDVVHLLGPGLYQAITLRTALGANWVVTGLTHTLSHAPFLEWWWLTLLARPRSTDTLICTTPTAQEVIHALQRHAPNVIRDAPRVSTTVIPLGVDATVFRTAPLLDRAALQIPREAVVVLTCGRLSYYTKADLLPALLMCREAMQRSRAPIYYVIAGSVGDERYDELLQIVAQEYGVADRVRIVGNPDEATKRGLYRAADLFFAPSDNLQETFGISVIEAMAAGLPVIAADWDGYRALVRDGETGVRVPTWTMVDSTSPLVPTAPLQLDSLRHLFQSQRVAWDLEAAVTAVVRLADDAVERSRLAVAAARAAAEYDWSVIAGHYFALWQELCARRSASETPVPSIALAYEDVFAGYATHALRDDDAVVCTDRGRAMLRGELPTRFYTAMEEILSIRLMAALLQAAAEPRTLASLTAKPPLNATPAQLCTHLLWLLKYGALQVITANA